MMRETAVASKFSGMTEMNRRDFTATLLASLLLRRRAATVDSDVMVRMRDGVRLATDVYRPSAAGRHPVILERTPYGKTIPSRSERTPSNPKPLSRADVAEFFVSRGYVFV